ncbi:hypothetical protein ES703_116347 [subsurface metagenome]
MGLPVLPCEFDDDVGGGSADLLRPCGILGLLVLLSEDVSLKLFEADAVLLHEAPVDQPLIDQDMEDGQHEGCIRARSDGDPLGPQGLDGSGPSGVDDDHLDPPGLGLPYPCLRHDLQPRVRDVGPPEDDQAGMLERTRVDPNRPRAEYIGSDVLGCLAAVVPGDLRAPP